MRKKGLRGLAAWMGSALTFAQLAGSHYQSPLVQALVAAGAALRPDARTPSAQMGKVIAFALEAAGAPIIKGGAGAAVAAFRGLDRENGGEIRTVPM